MMHFKLWVSLSAPISSRIFVNSLGDRIKSAVLFITIITILIPKHLLSVYFM